MHLPEIAIRMKMGCFDGFFFSINSCVMPYSVRGFQYKLDFVFLLTCNDQLVDWASCQSFCIKIELAKHSEASCCLSPIHHDTYAACSPLFNEHIGKKTFKLVSLYYCFRFVNLWSPSKVPRVACVSHTIDIIQVMASLRIWLQWFWCIFPCIHWKHTNKP